MAFDIFITLFLVALNGFFVAAEFAIVKVRSSQLAMKAKEGNRFAILLELTRSNFFSLAVWKSEESWKRWKSDMKSLKERNNYRKYKTRESLLFKIGK